MSETYEGNIIRTLRRLNELLKKMAAAANFIGNKVTIYIVRNSARNSSMEHRKYLEASFLPHLFTLNDINTY